MSILSVLSSERREVHRTEHGVNHRQSSGDPYTICTIVFTVGGLNEYLCVSAVYKLHIASFKKYVFVYTNSSPHEMSIGITVVERSEHALGSRGYCE